MNFIAKAPIVLVYGSEPSDISHFLFVFLTHIFAPFLASTYIYIFIHFCCSSLAFSHSSIYGVFVQHTTIHRHLIYKYIRRTFPLFLSLCGSFIIIFISHCVFILLSSQFHSILSIYLYIY